MNPVCLTRDSFFSLFCLTKRPNVAKNWLVGYSIRKSASAFAADSLAQKILLISSFSRQELGNDRIDSRFELNS